MITEISAKRILCFGDSNTWGQKPEIKDRYTGDERWTALLQRALGVHLTREAHANIAASLAPLMQGWV